MSRSLRELVPEWGRRGEFSDLEVILKGHIPKKVRNPYKLVSHDTAMFAILYSEDEVFSRCKKPPDAGDGSPRSTMTCSNNFGRFAQIGIASDPAYAAPGKRASSKMPHGSKSPKITTSRNNRKKYPQHIFLLETK